MAWHHDGAFMTPFCASGKYRDSNAPDTCSPRSNSRRTDFACGYSAFSAKLTSYAPPVLLACWANAWYPSSLVKYWASLNASGGRRMAAQNRLRSTSAPDRKALMNAMKFPVTASTAVSSGAPCGTRGLFESLPDVWTAWQRCSTTLQPCSPSHAANTKHASTSGCPGSVTRVVSPGGIGACPLHAGRWGPRSRIPVPRTTRRRRRSTPAAPEWRRHSG